MHAELGGLGFIPPLWTGQPAYPVVSLDLSTNL